MKKEMDKIADYLLLRSSYMQELGLFHGKMGVVVALLKMNMCIIPVWILIYNKHIPRLYLMAFRYIPFQET